MAPISKDNEVFNAPDSVAAGPTATGTRGEDTSSRPQAVALEVPVTVNGARTVEGSDKREPFSETTKTVLVFGGGAVIRLGSTVAPGQLLFLTNEKTKKEVVCQVVKSKNYRNVSGYVELEFTESVVGFWGMRFPSDRSASHPAAPSVRMPPPSKSLPVSPISVASSGTSKMPEFRSAQMATEAKPTAPAVPRTAAPPTPTTAAPALPSTMKPEVPGFTAPSISSGKKTTPGFTQVDGSHEELKLEAAHLQEQPSSLLFESASTTKTATPVAEPDSKSVSGLAAKILEIAKASPVPSKAPPLARPDPPPIKSSLDSEEVKIPSWLEPLARNAAIHAPTPEPNELEKSKHAAEDVVEEEPFAETAPARETVSETEVKLPSFGSLLAFDEQAASRESSSRASRKGLWISLTAAVVLLAAGAAWYQFNPSKALQAPAPPVSPAASIQTAGGQPQQPNTGSSEHLAARNEEASPESASRSTTLTRAGSAATSEPLAKSPASSQYNLNTRDKTRDSAATIPAAITERVPRSAPTPELEPKKPALGSVHLATPTMNRADTTQQDEVVAPTLSTASENANSEGFDSGLAAGNRKQPAAPEVPLPIGGDVTPARLISHVAPMYPLMAKNQHVSGDVVIDALIGVNGRVTAMKVISGPALLHQAAKDALHQWKYQPASLDGKPVPMHLSVTLQFRMQ